MFTLTQIQEAHKHVKTWADFPKYAQELTQMWVLSYDTFVYDGHAVYLGNKEPIIAPAKYETISIETTSNKEHFIERLRLHQSGGTDYMTFCRDCAENGVEKWTLDMIARTCTYYNQIGDVIIVEHFWE